MLFTGETFFNYVYIENELTLALNVLSRSVVLVVYRFDEGLALGMSAFGSLYSGQCTSSTQMIKQNYVGVCLIEFGTCQ